MSDWGTVFLGVIAVATLATAILQFALVVAAGRLARRLERLTDRIEQELPPLFVHLNAIARDAARAASVATAQVERVDRLFADVVQRVEETVRSVQNILTGPSREAGAVLAAFRAVFGLVRDIRRRRAKRRSEDEDALFI